MSGNGQHDCWLLSLGTGHTVTLKMVEGNIIIKAVVQRNTFTHKKVALARRSQGELEVKRKNG